MTFERLEKKFFGTDGIRGRVGEDCINPEFVLKLGWALGCVLKRSFEGRGKVLIGKDTRISGYMLESSLEAGLAAAGVDIRLLGPMPTPAIAYLTRTFRAKAGIVISASHNPYDDNGIKFFSSEGKKLDDALELAIEEQMQMPLVTVPSTQLGKASRIVDAPGRYTEFCKGTIPSSMRLDGMKIVIDCANGATYHIAPNVFRELGADVVLTGIRPDGFNINRDCGSMHPKALQKLVLQEKADVGIALDGDGDRVIMIDHQGDILDGDDLVFIIAKDAQDRGHLSGGVVGTVMSNLGLEKKFEQLNIPFIRTAVGDRHIISELYRRGWQIGGESSGHIVCLGITTTGDGIVSALQVLAAMHKKDVKLADLKNGYEKFPQAKLNIPIQHPLQVMASPDVQRAIQTAEATLQQKGRVLVRPSGTEPVIRIMVEGENEVIVQTLAEEIAKSISQTDN